MKKNIFNNITIAAFGMVIGMCSSAMAKPVAYATSAFFHTPFGALTFLPTALPFFIYGNTKITFSDNANQAVAAAQEPAYMVLNNQSDANENPLFKNAVSELKKENKQLVELGDLEMAAIILNISEQISSY